MDWITNGTAIISLITGLIGLITAGVTAFIAIKKVIKANKGKSLKEIWALIMKIADAAMVEAEKSQLSGKGKKEMVMAAVDAGAKEAGIEITPFLDQLSAYIDQSIKFVNDMNK